VKGIILAGGDGTRLSPITTSYSKQLLPVFDKPLIYYPLSTLMKMNIREILIIVKSHQKSNFVNLLGDGKKFGIKISYSTQDKPNGIAEALIIGNKFINKDSVALILGDNIFYGQDVKKNLDSIQFKNGAIVFLYKVKNPSQYGVANIVNSKLIKITEKPKKTKSNLAVTGLYIYDNNVVKYVKDLKPSKRKELEITDLNNMYIKKNKLNYVTLKESSVWFDAGTPTSLLLASQYIQALQERNNILVSSPEEIALTKRYIKKEVMKIHIKKEPKNLYYDYLKDILRKQ
tara:strand:- start:5332 stop:6195 length:864 start_codon:yes stop_codon:yes gene_type:complete